MKKIILLLVILLVNIGFTTTINAQKDYEAKGTIYKNALVRMEDIDGKKTELLPINNVKIHYISELKFYLIKTKVHHASMIAVKYQKTIDLMGKPFYFYTGYRINEDGETYGGKITVTSWGPKLSDYTKNTGGEVDYYGDRNFMITISDDLDDLPVIERHKFRSIELYPIKNKIQTPEPEDVGGYKGRATLLEKNGNEWVVNFSPKVLVSIAGKELPPDLYSFNIEIRIGDTFLFSGIFYNEEKDENTGKFKYSGFYGKDGKEYDNIQCLTKISLYDYIDGKAVVNGEEIFITNLDKDGKEFVALKILIGGVDV